MSTIAPPGARACGPFRYHAYDGDKGKHEVIDLTDGKHYWFSKAQLKACNLAESILYERLLQLS